MILDIEFSIYQNDLSLVPYGFLSPKSKAWGIWGMCIYRQGFWDISTQYTRFFLSIPPSVPVGNAYLMRCLGESVVTGALLPS